MGQGMPTANPWPLYLALLYVPAVLKLISAFTLFATAWHVVDTEVAPKTTRTRCFEAERFGRCHDTL